MHKIPNGFYSLQQCIRFLSTAKMLRGGMMLVGARLSHVSEQREILNHALAWALLNTFELVVQKYTANF